MFFSPLEQFLVISVFDFFFIPVTNEVIYLFLIILTSLFLFFSLNKKRNKGLFIVLGVWQNVLEKIFSFLLSTVLKNTNNFRGQKVFPFIFSIFFAIVLLNLFGLVPNSFTPTSHLIVTFGLGLAIFLGNTVICIVTHRSKIFSLFIPGQTPFVLALLLVPIEIISYFFKPLSLAIRLFANLMAGHTLMHVVAGFGFMFLSSQSEGYFAQYIPIVIILALFLLDVAVCTIQAFVFTILICIYLNDAFNLH